MVSWSNNREFLSWSTIDRFLLSPDWEDQFPEVSQSRLLRILSYHFLVVLDCGVAVMSSRYFKFENMLLKAAIYNIFTFFALISNNIFPFILFILCFPIFSFTKSLAHHMTGGF
jgi:hypothetical protein